MLTTILKQNGSIKNYILELNLPYFPVLKNHMINLVSGITVTEDSKTSSSNYSKLTCDRYRSTGSMFLSSYLWNNEYIPWIFNY